MSSGSLQRWGAELEAFPRFELAYLLDDPSAPTSVTILDPHSPDPTTHWITAGVETALPIETVS